MIGRLYLYHWWGSHGKILTYYMERGYLEKSKERMVTRYRLRDKELET